MESYQGEILDCRYLVENIIGKGGMGVVYQGKHIVVGRKVAIKFLNSEFSTQEDIVTRFYREAQNAAAIGHKNIIDILDVGITDRHEPYFVMEYLEGECLSSLLSRCGPIDLGAACGILEPVLRAIFAAHRKGIVHRDLKPDNIFLVHDPTDDVISVKLIDFGISKLIHMADNDKLTHAGSALGTPCYMSPEQAACAKDIDHRSDIYSMGVILFEMLTGSLPFEGESNQETMMQILTEAPPDPREVYSNFPEMALPIIERTLNRNPDERYQDAAEMLEALTSLTTFQARNERLAVLALGLSNKQCALGDLGRKIDPGETTDVPARVLTDLTRHQLTPASWTESKSKVSRFPKPNNRVAIILAGLTLLLTVTLIIFIYTIKERPPLPGSVVQMTPTQSVKSDSVEKNAVAPLAQAEQEVRIAIVGAPPRSTILYGDVVVPSNKFLVPIGQDPVALKIEARGYRSFTTEIVPNKNLTIDVKMPRILPTKKKRPQSSVSGDRYVKGRRKTEIVKEFE